MVAGVKVKVEGNEFFFDDQVAASWKDDYSETLTVDVQFIPENSSTGKAFESGETLFDAGKLQITVQDDAKNKSTAEIKLTSVAITGLESLMGKELTVDVPVNLLLDLTISKGLTLQKVEEEHDGQRSEIPDATKYIPEVPGSINIILTLSRTDGSTIEAKVENMTVNGIQYQAISITDIKPVDVFPQIAQIEAGDKNIYSYVEDLMVAETYVMRDMMTNYGTGKYTPEEYQQLLSRVTIGLIEEKPDDYQEYEWIGPAYIPNIYDHGNVTFKNLISLK